ncbi:MAG: hypothetical protein JWP14_546 [Frankiales bacterium]|nr:hypothetical protein [Frankiales bacterium]
MGNAISEKQWVGIDLHLHRSVIVRIDEHGKELEWIRIDSDPKALVRTPPRTTPFECAKAAKALA